MPVIDSTIQDSYAAYHGDCVSVLADLPANSIGYSVFSPPFASLYTYSDDARDMGNVSDEHEFGEQFAYLVRQLYRVLMPGRLLSFHCMNLPASKVRDGHIGLKDFRGQLIRAFQAGGFIYHSEVTIWKDPVTAMQRTKALGLLYKQIKKDSSMSRQGIPDVLVTVGKPPPSGEAGYLVTCRKPGVNPEPVTKTPDDFPVTLWQRYASPVWMDIDQSDTLNGRTAREHDDERHICPLQLGVIRRCVRLWSNPNDVVLSPFMGIGSEGVVSLEMGRRFVGVELKPSYYRHAVANLANVDQQQGLFGGAE